MGAQQLRHRRTVTPRRMEPVYMYRPDAVSIVSISADPPIGVQHVPDREFFVRALLRGCVSKHRESIE